MVILNDYIMILYF